MSAQATERPHDEPLFPMPPVAEAPLRAAVQRLSPVDAVRFEQEFRASWEEAVQTDCTVPMHTFLRRWAIFVSLHRYPARSARIRELERAVGQAETREEGRAAAEEVGQLLAEATAELADR